VADRFEFEAAATRPYRPLKKAQLLSKCITLVDIGCPEEMLEVKVEQTAETL
jgi:hypothetical protein